MLLYISILLYFLLLYFTFIKFIFYCFIINYNSTYLLGLFYCNFALFELFCTALAIQMYWAMQKDLPELMAAGSFLVWAWTDCFLCDSSVNKVPSALFIRPAFNFSSTLFIPVQHITNYIQGKQRPHRSQKIPLKRTNKEQMRKWNSQTLLVVKELCCVVICLVVL